MSEHRHIVKDSQQYIREIGTAIHAVTIPGAAYGKGRDQAVYIYAVSGGDPAVLNIVDPKNGEVISELPLNGASNAWGVTVDPNGIVYVGTYTNASLYRYDPETNVVENLGQPIPGEQFIWRVCSDENGCIYGGTYPGGKVFQYNPHTGTFRDYGQIVKGQQYARSIAVHRQKGYIGIGTNGAHLIELDLVTGKRKEIELPTKYREQTNVYDLNVVENKLFARITRMNTLLVFDLNDMRLIDEIEHVDGLDVSTPDSNQNVYLVVNEKLHAYHLGSLELRETAFDHFSSARGFGWIDLHEEDFSGPTLISMAVNGDIRQYNVRTERYRTVKSRIKGQPVVIQSLKKGPNGNIFIGGYFSGGLSEYDVETDQLIEYKGIGQIEGMITHEERLYMGVYTNARIYSYDPKEPYHFGMNPVEHFKLDKFDQDRPFAFASAGDQLAIGTVPIYGKQQGALTIYRPENGAYQVYQNVVHNQSIISLTYRNGLLYGGTSVWGGLGIKPAEKEAKLFVWDVDKERKVAEWTPIQGEKAISALTFDQEGYLWGITLGMLFKFDIQKSETVFTKQIQPVKWEKLNHLWRGGHLIMGDDGFLYGQTLGELFRIHIGTYEYEKLAEDTLLLARDDRGNVYFAREDKLYQYVI